MENMTVIDDMETTAKIWNGWSVRSLDNTVIQTFLPENDEQDFTKQDFEKALKRVSRKIKK